MSAESQTSAKWDEKLFSNACNTLLRSIDSEPDGVHIGRLLEILREIRSEYGTSGNPGEDPVADLIALLRSRESSMTATRYPAIEWAGKVHAVTNTAKNFPDINGRMFLIAALLSEFHETSRLLGNDVRWRRLTSTLIVKLESELLTEKRIDMSRLLTDYGHSLRALIDISEETSDWKEHDSLINTHNLSDAPTKVDALSRKTLATYLAKRLRFIYNRDIENLSAFFVNIDGAWGSGKSTLLGFLQKALEAKAPSNPRINPSQPSEGEWIVVNFNAWENQRLDPPWWFLLKALHRQAMKALWKRDFRRWLGVGLTERLWRLNPGGKNLQLSLVALCIFIFARYYGVTSKESLNALPLVQLVTFLVFIWSIAKAAGSMLLSGSAKAAQAFVEENSSDPMNRLTLHFNKLITEIGYPVAIFIDDLDRCNKEYGVKLLEGLQTIYKNAPVVYVIAADRKWLSTMYENQYSLFAPAITKPAKPFGFVFLDKVFQWTVELPEISASQKKMYWNSLLNIRDETQHTDGQDVGLQIRNEDSLQGKLGVVDRATDPRMMQEARELVIDSLSVQEEEKVLEHKLQNYVSLIEPNPRAMKRLVNDISTAKAMTILYSQRISEDQLILWTILKQQYPELARVLWEKPEVAGTVLADAPALKTFSELLGREEVRQLFAYDIKGKTIRLDSEFLNRMKFQETIIETGSTKN
jgi:hypothetical protein